MRLIQQNPAWTLHAYLRFLELDYTTENCVGYNALGVQLPLIVDKVYTKSEDLALNYLTKTYGGDMFELSANTMFSAFLKQSLVIPLDQIKRINGTENKNMFRAMPLGLNVAFSVMHDVREFVGGNR